MRNKCKWHSILLVGLALLLTSSVIACQTTTQPSPSVGEEELPSNAIAWNEAKYHIGERTTVYGSVAGTHWASSSNGKPTFLNIGRDYPDPNRFTVVIWIDYRGNFTQAPEVYYLGKTIYVTGLITEYQGSAQIEVKYPSQIQEQ